MKQANQWLAIAEEFQAPLYVYDTAVIRRQYERLSKAFSDGIHIKYACKALSNPNILRFIKELGSGLDTVSIQEVELGLRVGFAPENIIFTPNGVNFQEIRQAVEKGVVVNIDNISCLEQFGHAYGGSVPVCIRLNPHILAGGHYEISTGHIDSKFGISIHQMRHVQRVIKSTGIRVNGLHMHTGSEIIDVDAFIRGFDILLETARDFPDLDFIDFGSGFKVPYKPGGLETDIETLGEKLSERFRIFCENYGKPLELWCEPGKFIVSEAGVFLSKVNVIKQTPATVFVGVDSGMNHLMRPKLYNAYHRITNLSNPNGIERIYTVVGYICETDTFAADRRLNEVREGDVLAFHNAGGYGFAMASQYNSRPRPAEVMVVDGRAQLIRRHEVLEDLLATVVEPVGIYD